MKNNDQIIKLALATGWSVHGWEWSPPPTWWDTPFGKSYLNDREGGIIHPPDYVNDLNAIQWAESLLSYEVRCEALRQLVLLCDSYYGNGEVEPSNVYNEIEMSVMFLQATCSLRCKALLIALDVWEGSDHEIR